MICIYYFIDKFHLFSILGLRLFGRSYSGLEYDYLGLCHIYEVLREYEKYLKYANMLDNWQILRGQNLTMNVSKLFVFTYRKRRTISYFP